MSNDRPRVSIGLPVYNGEIYLAEALDSLLAQTFTDFELVIADNASTDATGEICQAYAVKDSRIRYIRNPENLGAAANYNRVFELSSGQYFKWAAHDDLCAPEFLERCVGVLDRDESVVLCYSLTKAIDENGQVTREYAAKPKSGSVRPRDRFYEFVCVPHPCVAVFGLMRTSVLGRTPLIGNYTGSDRPLLGELSLLGRFHEIPEFLFFYRNHPQQSWQLHPTSYAYEEWFDPARSERWTLPNWRLLWEHLRSVGRVPLGWQERVGCYACVGWYIRKRWRYLAGDLIRREPEDK